MFAIYPKRVAEEHMYMIRNGWVDRSLGGSACGYQNQNKSLIEVRSRKVAEPSRIFSYSNN